MSKPEVVVAMYRPKPGKLQELEPLVRKHFPILKEYGLTTDKAPFIGRSSYGTILRFLIGLRKVWFDGQNLNAASGFIIEKCKIFITGFVIDQTWIVSRHHGTTPKSREGCSETDSC